MFQRKNNFVYMQALLMTILIICFNVNCHCLEPRVVFSFCWLFSVGSSLFSAASGSFLVLLLDCRFACQTCRNHSPSHHPSMVSFLFLSFETYVPARRWFYGVLNCFPLSLKVPTSWEADRSLRRKKTLILTVTRNIFCFSALYLST